MTIMNSGSRVEKGLAEGDGWQFAVVKGIARWLIVAAVMVAWSVPGVAQEVPPNVRLMDTEMQNFLGPDIVSFCCGNDEQGNDILYVRGDIYEDMQTINYNQEVQFPESCINKVKLVKEQSSDAPIIHIKYEGSPEKTMECKKVNGVYKCYSS